MLDSRGMRLSVRRGSKPLAISIFLALCLLIWYARPQIRTWETGIPLRPLTAVSPSSPDPGALRIVPQSRILEQRPAEGNAQAPLASTSQNADTQIPIVIFAFNRATNLRRTMESVFSSASFSPSLHPIFISQDGNNPDVTEVIKSYGDRVQHLKYRWTGKVKPEQMKEDPPVTPYLKIAGHYQFALTEVMDRVDGHDRWDRLIMLEDDMYVSPDFFSYFRRMSPLFDTDQSLYCVSAWNDHGQEQFVSNATSLYRTDCFPGLGWMWSRERWNELRQWTPGWWDDWLREPAQRKGRSCIFPEVSRVYTFDIGGTSFGWAFETWLREMVLNEENVQWNEIDIAQLDGQQYDHWLEKELRSAVRANTVREARLAIRGDLAGRVKGADVKDRIVGYSDLEDLTDLMGLIGLLFEHKANVPRASYRGVLQFRYRGSRIWLVPDSFKVE